MKQGGADVAKVKQGGADVAKVKQGGADVAKVSLLSTSTIFMQQRQCCHALSRV